jgi:hypothetical protein
VDDPRTCYLRNGAGRSMLTNRDPSPSPPARHAGPSSRSIPGWPVALAFKQPAAETDIGAAAALSGGFVGAWWQGRGQPRIERNRQRERATDVLAP